MDLRSLILCLASASLALTGFLYGAKFVRKGNYLIGVEWMILGTSSANAVYYFASGSPTAFAVAHFFDTFSRAFGVPVVLPIGLMMVMRRWRPSIGFDIAVFALSFAATFGLLTGGIVAEVLPYFLLFMSVVLAAFMIYFTGLLLKVGEVGQAVGMCAVIVTSFFISAIYDFWRIPGEDTNVVFNFYTLALLTWSYMTVQIYYAYRALERALAARSPSSGRSAFVSATAR